MQTLDILHTSIAITTSFLMVIVVWWKVSKDTELNRKAIELQGTEIANLKVTKTDIAVTAKLIEAVEQIQKNLTTHHTDFNVHRTADSERRMSDLVSSVNELAKENRADHQVIMNKLGRVERMDEKQ